MTSCKRGIFLMLAVTAFLGAVFFIGAENVLAKFRPDVQVNSDPGNLNNDLEPAIIVADNGNIYITWNLAEGILFSRSIDGGNTFSEAVRVNHDVTYPSNYKAYNPDIALGGSGEIYIVWHDYRAWATDASYTSPVDVYISKSTDGGLTWGTSVKATNGSGYYPWHNKPRIAVDKNNGNIYVTFTDYNRYYPQGDARDVSFARSINGGVSFEPQQKIDDSGMTVAQKWSSIDVDQASGDVYVALQDARLGREDVYVTKSVDNGQIFGANVLVNDVTDIDQEEPDIQVDSSGNIFVVWKDWRDDLDRANAPYDNHIYLAKSTDGGATYSASVKITDEYMQAKDGFVYPPHVAVNANEIHVVWHDSRAGYTNAYYDYSSDGGQTFSTDTVISSDTQSVSHSLPRIDLDAQGVPNIVWIDKRNGNDKYDVFFTKTETGRTDPITINVPADYLKIQEAIDHAIGGDTIQVAAGTYSENIVINKSVAIKGDGFQITAIDGGGISPVVKVEDNVDAVISGFSVIGGKPGYSGQPGQDAGIFCMPESNLAIKDNIIRAGTLYGIEYAGGASVPLVARNIISGHERYGISDSNASPFIENNRIYDNGWAGVYSWNASAQPKIRNNVIYGNGRGIGYKNNSAPVIENNIIFDNSIFGIGEEFGNHGHSYAYNDVFNNAENYRNVTAGTGALEEDPLFVDVTNEIFRLQKTSNARNAGNPSTDFNDPDGTRNDMGVYGGPGAERYGDINRDGFVNIKDIQICIKAIVAPGALTDLDYLPRCQSVAPPIEIVNIKDIQAIIRAIIDP